MVMITDEFIVLWEKFSFPTLSKQTIIYKVCKLIEANDKNRKKKKDSFQVELENIFEITKTDGNWLCQEDKLTIYKLNHKVKLNFLQAKLLHNHPSIPLSTPKINITSHTKRYDSPRYR